MAVPPTFDSFSMVRQHHVFPARHAISRTGSTTAAMGNCPGEPGDPEFNGPTPG